MTRTKGSKNKPRLPLSPLSIPNPSPSESSASSVPSEEVDEPTPLVPVEVEAHAQSEQSIGERLADKLRGVVEEGSTEKPLSESARASREWRAKRKGAASNTEREEASTLILTVFVVAVAALDMPDTLKPERSELEVVSSRLVSILARHNLLLGKLSGDALDIVAIIAVGAQWYTRVAPEIRRLRGNRDGGGGGGRKPGPAPVGPVPSDGKAETSSPISSVDVVTGQWLDNQLQSKGGEE